MVRQHYFIMQHLFYIKPLNHSEVIKVPIDTTKFPRLFAVPNKEFMMSFRIIAFSSIVLPKKFSEKTRTDFLIKWLSMATCCLFTLLLHPSIPSNTIWKWNLTKKLFSHSLRYHAYELYHVSRDHAFVVSHLIYKCR